jgi:hypothetical protein
MNNFQDSVLYGMQYIKVKNKYPKSLERIERNDK